MKTTAALLLAILCSVGHAQSPLSAAVQQISQTGIFAFGGVGFIGKTSEGEIDFRVIESQPTAVALENFEKIYDNGDNAAKSYALVGIRNLDKERFNTLFQSLQGTREKVFTMRGCVMEQENLADIAKAINAGSYDGYLRPREPVRDGTADANR